MPQLFDNWPDLYERWFETPIGALVKSVELELVLKLLQPQVGEHILDAGCGTGIFTAPLLERGSRITGLDLSLPMLKRAQIHLPEQSFLAADMGALPFADGSFDKVVSITAIEFIESGKQALAELFRVTRPGGLVVVATLNSLSPWAKHRKDKAENNSVSLFYHAWFRSPEMLLDLAPVLGQTYTAIHFAKDCNPSLALEIEQQGQAGKLNTGAFLVGCWRKPEKV
ncbi:MAG: class I SAM-dependent methyltransferase [Candidatus Polarisedimenticolaceae bacterium]|nr:class I SAM-dependent methyltransferase [Candidatus Polarisedimenticolaceae bacterium]